MHMTVRRLFGLATLLLVPWVIDVSPASPTSVSSPTAARLLVDSGAGIQSVAQDGSERTSLITEGHSGDRTSDGSRIVFVRSTNRVDESGFYRYTHRLYLADGDGSNQRPLANGRIFGTTPRWSPDGRRIAFNLEDEDRRVDRNPPNLIGIVDADQTGDAITIVAAGNAADWSPDGRHLVYVANNRIWTIAARPGEVATAITPVMDVTAVTPPKWSPDGTVIGFGAREIHLVHPDGSGLRSVGQQAATEFYVFDAWGPDSRSFASHYIGFHQWSSSSWTDPSTGARHGLPPNEWVTDWAAASGGDASCGSGYWLLGRDGGVFTFGSAVFHGSTGGMRLNQPVVGIAATPTGNGYWLVAGDGGIFTFGDARFHGSTGALRLTAPVVGMAATPTGNGYWLVAGDGGIFTFGDARFHGSTGALRLAAPVVGMAATPTGNGYWLAGADGGVFTLGDAPFPGAAANPGLAQPVAAATNVGYGMLMATTAGEVVALGDARFCGSAKTLRLAAPIVAAAING